MTSTRISILILACVLTIASCAKTRQLMPTPTLYTGEEATFSREELEAMTTLALRGIEELTRLQEDALAEAGASR